MLNREVPCQKKKMKMITVRVPESLRDAAQ